MTKKNSLLSYQDRFDRHLLWFTIAVAIVTWLILFNIPSGLDDEWIDHSQLHSSSLLQRMASYF